MAYKTILNPHNGKLQRISTGGGGSSDVEELNDLTDVYIENVQDGQVLVYNEITDRFENQALDITLEDISIFNEVPTEISSLVYELDHEYVSGTLRVFINGIKELDIIELSANRLQIPYDLEVDDEIEVNYIRSSEVLISSEYIFNEVPTEISALVYETANEYESGTLRVFINGIKEKDINETSTQRFEVPYELSVSDTIELNYIKKSV